MDKSKRPTKAAIEAALSAYYAEVDEAARHDAFSEHQRVFDEIVMDSEDLQGVIIGVSTAMSIESFRRRTHGEPSQEGPGSGCCWSAR